MSHLEPSQEAGRIFLSRNLTGEVVMLNLLRFRAVADYSRHPQLAPPEPISGEEAYRRYMKHSLPFVEEAGASVLFAGRGGQHLIGPLDEHWDMVLLVRHASVQAFMSFAANEGYLAGLGHRTAALEDSRLLPITESL